jgi:hypothetical protein
MVRILKPDLMAKIKSFFSRIATFFSSGAAKKALDTAAALVPEAMPFLDIATQIAAGLTPTTVDDALLAEIHATFPRLFDGSLATGDEVKLYLLGIATQLLQARFPQVSTSVARAAVQVAYTAQHA